MLLGDGLLSLIPYLVLKLLPIISSYAFLTIHALLGYLNVFNI